MTRPTTKFVPTASYVKKEPAIKDYTLYYGNAATMLEISQAFAMALVSLDYTKHKGEGNNWVFTEADVVTEGYLDRTQFHNMMIVGIAGIGVFVFVAIMRFGGNMGRAYNTAMDRLRPSEGPGEAVQEAELDAEAVNMEEDLPERSIPDIRKS